MLYVSCLAGAGETLRCLEENPGTQVSWVLFHLQTEKSKILHSNFCGQFLQGGGGAPQQQQLTVSSTMPEQFLTSCI